jgi:hypothetical protein
MSGDAVNVNGMARPVSKGETIGFRLPLDVDEHVRHCADMHDETPAEYLARRITEAYERVLERQERIAGTVSEPTGCEHLHAPFISSNTPLRRCERCQAVEGRDGVWRLIRQSA